MNTNTYETPESVIVVKTTQQEPTLTDKAKDILQQVGEKIGLVQSPAIVPVSSPSHLTGPLAEIKEVRSEMGLSNTEQQKPLADRAKDTIDYVGASIEPYTEIVKDTLYQAGETLGFVQPVQNIDGPLAEIQDVRQDMGKSKMDQPIQKPLSERAKETWNEAGERIEPYAEKARETWYQAGERIEPYVEKSKESLHQAGETLGFIKPVQNIEGPLAEIQDVRQEMGWSKMEQPVQKPLTVRAKESWNEAGERIEPYAEKARESLQQAGETLSFATEKAKETWNEAGERIEPYVEKSKESLYKAGETLGFIKPVQNIEGPLAEIQDVRKDMGWSRMEQPIQKPLTERAKESWNEAGERLEPYAEKARVTLNQASERIEPYAQKARETINQAGERIEPYVEKSKESLQQAGETLGFIKPVQNIEGPLAEIQDVRKEKGWSRMEQPIQKPLTERAKESWNEAGERIEPYTEKAKESLYQAGETLGFVKPAQNIDGPLAEIQDVRKDMGWSRMEQPVQKPLTERAKESWNEAGERLEPYAEKARETWNEAGERIEPYVEKSKESLQQAGETLGFVKPAQNIEGPLAEIQDVRKDMGWSRMEQPVQKPLSERAKESWNEAGERLEPYAEKARETWNEAGNRIEPYVEKSKESLQQAGETLGFVKPAQNIEGPLAEIQDVRKEMGKSKMEQPIQKPLTERAKETWNEAGARIEPYTEKAKESLYEAGEKIGLVNNSQNQNIVQQTPFVGSNLSPTNEKIELYAENAGDDSCPVVDEVGVINKGFTGESEMAKTKIAPENEFTMGSSTKTLPA